MRCKKTIYTIMYWSVIEKSYTTVYFGNDTEEKKKTIETLMYLLGFKHIHEKKTIVNGIRSITIYLS